MNDLSGYCVEFCYVEFCVILENHLGSEEIIHCFHSNEDDPM
jgi:hypothetical protein